MQWKQDQVRKNYLKSSLSQQDLNPKFYKTNNIRRGKSKHFKNYIFQYFQESMVVGRVIRQKTFCLFRKFYWYQCIQQLKVVSLTDAVSISLTTVSVDSSSSYTNYVSSQAIVLYILIFTDEILFLLHCVYVVLSKLPFISTFSARSTTNSEDTTLEIFLAHLLPKTFSMVMTVLTLGKTKWLQLCLGI